MSAITQMQDIYVLLLLRLFEAKLMPINLGQYH